MLRQTDKENTRIPSLVGTLIFAGLLFLLLYCYKLYKPYPPPPEYGVEVNLGYADEGYGEEAVAESTPSKSAPMSSPASEEALITSNDQEAPALKVSPEKKVQPKTVEQEQPTKKVEEEIKQTINPNALYPGKKSNNTEAKSQGNKKGEGDMGKPDGSLHGTSYEGSGGGGGGISFSLSGRTLMSLTRPDYNSDEQGMVVVKIWVNREGSVIRTQVGVQGTTTMDESLWETARKAALSSKFVPKESAPEEQVGTIRYKFVIGQ